MREKIRMPRPYFFTILVDRIFTTSFERLFTKLFDASCANSTKPCLYRGCNAD
jgi:hypothetical protein